MKRYLPIVLIALAVFATRAKADNLIQNGEFATGDFSYWMLGTTSNGTAGQGFPIVGTWPFGGGHNAWEGEVGEVTEQNQQAGATLSQPFSAFMDGEVRISFQLGVMGGANDDPDGGDFSVKLDGTQLSTFDIGPIKANQLFHSEAIDITDVSAGQHTLEIDITRQGLSASGLTPYQFVTDVFVDGSDVPEPSSLALMGSGVLALAGAARRRLS